MWLDSFPLDPAVKQALIKKAGGGVRLVKSFQSCADGILDRETIVRMQATLADATYFEVVQKQLTTEWITPVFYGAERYPRGWLTLSDAPLCLYAKGNLNLLGRRMFAAVGSRRTTESAKKQGREICKELALRFAVVSGSADGGDEAALSGALLGGGAICLLAGGFGSQPKENPLLPRLQQEGLLLAACPFDTPVRVYSYEYRNKLLAAMSEGVLVLGAAKKSGALITAHYAKSQGKQVFALPYAPSVAAGEGCNALIKAGANLTESAQDILPRYGWETAAKRQIDLTDAEWALVQILQEKGEAHISELARLSEIPAFKLTAILSSLEVKGAVVKLGGNRYSAV